MSFDLQSVVGIAAGVFTSFSLVPQLIKMLKEKKYDSVSPVMLIVLMIGLSLWVVYGFMRNDWPIIVTNLFSLVVNLTILSLRLFHGKSQSQSSR
jgi:MtN3 and saliva related transmembrane protein